MLEVLLPDGSTKELQDGSSAMDVAESIGSRLAQAVVVAEVDGTVVDANRQIADVTEKRPAPLRLLTDRDSDALGVLRHSCAHVMARAVMRLYSGVSLAFGPTKGNGFYYDFELDHKITEEDFPKIEAEMKQIIKAAEPFERLQMDREAALNMCQEMGQELKVEHIQTGLADHEQLGFYQQGEFLDLCRGPHIPHAGKIKAFKLMSVAGSFWKGDVNNRQLQRLYGTAWFSKKDLKGYLERLEEAKRRDHRVIGKQLGLFQINPDVGQGLCQWLPKGATVRILLEDFLRKELLSRGYQPVYSAHIGRVELYETSGHFPYYRESQFAPICMHDGSRIADVMQRRLDPQDESPALTSEEENKLLAAAEVLGCCPPGYHEAEDDKGKLKSLQQWQSQQERYLLKPMNCPHHAQMFAATSRSYRDLPLRLFEFGSVYRYEQTGELSGMLRVRGLTQDDAHIFCTPEQVEEEFRATLELTKFVLSSVGFTDYKVQLSLRDPNSDKYVGSEENWQKAEAALRQVLEESGLPFEACEGEAAFYGPKADFMVRDCIGRQWQLGTVQLDYNLPERFKLEYVGSDNSTHRPVMIHRAPFGSMERFVGMLIEHFAGAFPMWLAPEQVRVLPLSEKSVDYAMATAKRLTEAGFRVTTDVSNSKLQARIRDAQLELIPYMAVVGPKEAEQSQVSLRDRIDGDLGPMHIDAAIEHLRKEVDGRVVRQVVTSKLEVVEDTTESNEY